MIPSMGSLGGSSFLSSAMDLYGQHRSQGMQSKEARTSRSWQYQMDSTKYQRTIKDMKKAGINPILAAKLGGGSTPSGAQANIGMLDVNKAAQTAKEIGLLNATKNQIKQATLTADAQEKALKQDVYTKQAQEEMYFADAQHKRMLAQMEGFRALQEGIFTNYAMNNKKLFLLDRGAYGGAINLGRSLVKGASGAYGLHKTIQKMEQKLRQLSKPKKKK